MPRLAKAKCLGYASGFLQHCLGRLFEWMRKLHSSFYLMFDWIDKKQCYTFSLISLFVNEFVSYLVDLKELFPFLFFKLFLNIRLGKNTVFLNCLTWKLPTLNWNDVEWLHLYVLFSVGFLVLDDHIFIFNNQYWWSFSKFSGCRRHWIS